MDGTDALQSLRHCFIVTGKRKCALTCIKYFKDKRNPTPWRWSCPPRRAADCRSPSPKGVIDILSRWAVTAACSRTVVKKNFRASPSPRRPAKEQLVLFFVVMFLLTSKFRCDKKTFALRYKVFRNANSGTCSRCRNRSPARSSL